MTFGIVCLCIAAVMLVLIVMTAWKVSSRLELTLFFIFLISLIAGIVSINEESAVMGIIVIVVGLIISGIILFGN